MMDLMEKRINLNTDCWKRITGKEIQQKKTKSNYSDKSHKKLSLTNGQN